MSVQSQLILVYITLGLVSCVCVWLAVLSMTCIRATNDVMRHMELVSQDIQKVDAALSQGELGAASARSRTMWGD